MEVGVRDYKRVHAINVGVGRDVTIAELVSLFTGVVGFKGQFGFDTSRPDATPRAAAIRPRPMCCHSSCVASARRFPLHACFKAEGDAPHFERTQFDLVKHGLQTRARRRSRGLRRRET
jgi:hypothetical protein